MGEKDKESKESLDMQTLAESLSPIERKTLPALGLHRLSSEDIAEKADCDKTTVLRALEYLKKKNLVEIESLEKKFVILGVNGLLYVKKHLPERRLLLALDKEKEILFKDISKKADLNEDETKIAIGVLKKKALASVSNGKIILEAKKSEIAKKTLEEVLLEKLPMGFEELKPEEKFAFEELKKRKDIIEIEDKKDVFAKLTKSGEKLSKMDLDSGLIEQLTPKILLTNAWKGKKFRRYDLTSEVPKLSGGKRYFINQATDHAKNLWLEMGFKEMTGNMVQTGFWNFDVLFTAQDHPAREMQDTFFIKGVEGKLPEDKKFVSSIKQAHETGFDKSKGWQYTWEEKDAKKVLMRTHTTCLSGQTLKKIAEKKEFPAKYFALGKCFRNETVDWGHGFEFNQTEGIVIDENANFRQLLGYLKEFFSKMGYDKIRIRPAYFPYTEPSLEIDVWHPVKQKWFELGGAGMFRPELTIPIFGKHIPVLAWGPGFDRIIMEYFKITDFREMYKNNITKLRDMKFWMK